MLFLHSFLSSSARKGSGFLCSLDSEAPVTQGIPVPWLAGAWGEAGCRFLLARRSGRPPEAMGRRAQSTQGWRRGKATEARSRARDRGRPGESAPTHSCRDGRRRRLARRGHSPPAAAGGRPVPDSREWESWHRCLDAGEGEGRCSVLYLNGSWRVPRPGTGPLPPGLAGGRSEMLFPCQGVQPPPQHLRARALFP